ncbi:MAG: fructofuranosidase/invertase [Cytophagia bacterium]|nr:fructofuranosidase/invertase [Cytophagia bacterium]
METISDYAKAIGLLKQSATPQGFLASATETANYKRIWARDGVVCGLAALASGQEELIDVFRKTLETLSTHQHENGTIPSNVLFKEDGSASVSYGGLAGRVDALTWYVIGMCQYAHYKNDAAFISRHQSHIEKCLALLEAWEFNNRHLVYVPLSGNWADEYILEGYVLYDQLLRLWALQCYNYFARQEAIAEKINAIRQQIEINFIPGTHGDKYHPRAYAEIEQLAYLPCCFSPAGYKTQFDTFAHALALMLRIGTPPLHTNIANHAATLRHHTLLKALPAFWPPVKEGDVDWNLLKNNYKYEFRNHPYEFHNGGSWSMVNGFFGLAIKELNRGEAEALLSSIHVMNSAANDAFYECFDTNTGAVVGVPYCAWSAAGAVLLHQTLFTPFKLLF